MRPLSWCAVKHPRAPGTWTRSWGGPGKQKLVIMKNRWGKQRMHVTAVMAKLHAFSRWGTPEEEEDARA